MPVPGPSWAPEDCPNTLSLSLLKRMRPTSPLASEQCVQAQERGVCKAEQAFGFQHSLRMGQDEYTCPSNTLNLQDGESLVFPLHLYSLSLSTLNGEMGSSVSPPFPLANPLTMNLAARAQLGKVGLTASSGS